MDIHLERGNANKIMNRLLIELVDFGIKIVSIDGGSLRNAIPRESFASIIINDENAIYRLEHLIANIKKEFVISDGDLAISYNKIICQANPCLIVTPLK